MLNSNTRYLRQELRLVALALMLLLSNAACVPIWHGQRYEEDIDKLQRQQQEIIDNAHTEREEIRSLVEGAREDVNELKSVLQEARDLLQRSNADLGVDLSQTREELERLRGTAEEVEFRLLRLERELNFFKEDVDLRLSSGGHSSAQLPDDPTELLSFAQTKIEAHEYGLGRRAADRFVSRFPEHKQVDVAIFLLGESYFHEEQWVSAVFEYQKVLQEHRKSSKLADATFRIGQAFVRLDKCEAAIVFFDTIINEYPKSPYKNDAEALYEKLSNGQCSF